MQYLLFYPFFWWFTNFHDILKSVFKNTFQKIMGIHLFLINFFVKILLNLTHFHCHINLFCALFQHNVFMHLSYRTHMKNSKNHIHFLILDCLNIFSLIRFSNFDFTLTGGILFYFRWCLYHINNFKFPCYLFSFILCSCFKFNLFRMMSTSYHFIIYMNDFHFPSIKIVKN